MRAEPVLVKLTTTGPCGFLSSMMLTTKTKVALAGMAYRAIAIGRAIVRKDHWATIPRGDIQWRLDLSEGIDFLIYLPSPFERSAVLTLRKLVRPRDTVFDIGA